MKHSYDSYMLYQTGKTIRNAVRVKITMKDPVDLEVLRTSVNEATDRYPYFKKKITLDNEGAYVLEENTLPVVVLPAAEETVPIGCEKVNRHLLYAEAEGNNIDLCISHTLAGGKGIQPWVMTCLYQYVTNKYGVSADAPAIRKVGSPFLPTECIEPDYSMLPKKEEMNRPEFGKCAMLLKDYLNGFANPFMKKEHYYAFEVSQKLFLERCHEANTSVAGLLDVLLFKTFYKALPEHSGMIRCSMAHNPCAAMGIPDSRYDFLSHIHVDYPREMAEKSLAELGTYTRAQINAQKDLKCAGVEVYNKLKMIDGIDSMNNLKAKRKHAKKHNASLGKGAVHGTCHMNYTGNMDWGELADYIVSFVYIVDGHWTVEVSALNDRLFIAPMALVNTEKYIKAFCEVLNETQIPYKMEGPFAKRLPWQEFPRK